MKSSQKAVNKWNTGEILLWLWEPPRWRFLLCWELWSHWVYYIMTDYYILGLQIMKLQLWKYKTNFILFTHSSRLKSQQVSWNQIVVWHLKLVSIHHITVRDGNSLCSSPPCRFLSGELAAELLHFQLIITQTCQRLYAPRRLMFVKKRDGWYKSSVITVPSGFIYFSCWITVRLLILVTLPVAGSVWAWHHKCAIRIKPPPRGSKVTLANFLFLCLFYISAAVSSRLSILPEADVDICIYLFKLWLRLVTSQCSNRHFYIVL